MFDGVKQHFIIRRNGSWARMHRQSAACIAANCNLVSNTQKTSVFTTNSILCRFLVTIILLLVAQWASCGFVNDDGFYLTEDLSDSETLQAVRCTGIYIEIDWFVLKNAKEICSPLFLNENWLQAEPHRVPIGRCYRPTLPMSRYTCFHTKQTSNGLMSNN